MLKIFLFVLVLHVFKADSYGAFGPYLGSRQHQYSSNPSDVSRYPPSSAIPSYAVDHEGRQQLGNSEINDQEADNLGTRIVETVKVPVRIVYRVIYYASPQALPTPVNLNSRTQFQSQDQNFNKGVLTQKQYQSGNSQSQHQHQNQNSVSMQQYPTMSPTIRQQMKPNILPNRQEWPERTTATNKELNEKQFASEAYLPPSTTPRTTKLWSTTQETRTQYFPKPSAPQQNYRPYPAPKVQTEIPQRSVEKTTTELNEKPPVDMSTVMKNPTRKIVFPDGDHHELEIDASYMPDYLNLNKKLTTREPLKFEKANSEIEYVNPIRGK